MNKWGRKRNGRERMNEQREKKCFHLISIRKQGGENSTGKEAQCSHTSYHVSNFTLAEPAQLAIQSQCKWAATPHTMDLNGSRCHNFWAVMFRYFKFTICLYENC